MEKYVMNLSKLTLSLFAVALVTTPVYAEGGLLSVWGGGKPTTSMASYVVRRNKKLVSMRVCQSLLFGSNFMPAFLMSRPKQQQRWLEQQPTRMWMDVGRYKPWRAQQPTLGWHTGPIGAVAPDLLAMEDSLVRHPSSRLVAPGYRPAPLTGDALVSRLSEQSAQWRPYFSQLREPRRNLRGQVPGRWNGIPPPITERSLFEMPFATNLNTTMMEKDAAEPYQLPAGFVHYGSVLFTQTRGQEE